MSSAIRALVVILVLAAGVVAGSYYVHARASQSADDPTTSVASLDIGSVLGPQMVDQQLLSLAYREVERVYYRPIDSQTLIEGEHKALEAYLRSSLKGKAKPTLPAPQSGGNPSADLNALDRQLAYAQDHYARYLGPDAGTALTQTALSGMLGALHDPYTVYLSPDQIRSLNEELNGGDFGGIGVFIYQLKNGEVIVQPIEGMPAAQAGMHGNEVVQSVDGQPVRGMALDRVERLIRGPEGSVVTLITHPYKSSKTHHFRITRQIIHVPTVHAKMEDGYEYIRLSDFGETSAAEVRKALLSGKAHGSKGTILDLRDNGGGLLTAAVDISSFFVPSGAIVTEIDRSGHRDTQYANGDAIPGLEPVVILVNGYTASASEITSGALQDYKLATLIGTKTFGKGVVQGIFSLPNGGALKITTQRYVTPNGRDIQHKGIEPDIVVPQSTDLSIIDTPKDKQLQAAKAFLERHAR